LFVKPFSWVVLTFIIGQLLTMIISTCKIAFLTMASENLNQSLALAKDTLQNYQVLQYNIKKYDKIKANRVFSIFGLVYVHYHAT